MAADAIGMNLLLINTDCHSDCLLTADGAMQANGTSSGVSGIICTKADINTAIHGGNGFIASFLDGHVLFINPANTPLYDAIDLTNATTGSVTYTGNTNINSILYQGERCIYTFDATAGTMTGYTITSKPFTANVSLPALQYFAIHVINVPNTNNTGSQTTPTAIPIINVVTPAGSQMNVVNFGNNTSNVLQSGKYYTYSVNPFAARVRIRCPSCPLITR